MAGYSGTPLAKKLGLKAGHVLVLANDPPGFDELLAPLPPDVETRRDLRKKCDVAVAFFTSRAAFADRLPKLTEAIFPAGSLWVAWPKRASKVPTDLTEDVVREIALPTGLVDNKVCAIDEIWSGLRLVVRKHLR